MRTGALLTLLVATAATVAGCGGADRTAPAAPVRLTVSAPADLASTRADTLTVSGRVTPSDAAVHVLGQPAEVVAGTFTARVPLQPGANVIDLEATASNRGPAMTALRVTREMPIAVPDLAHLTPGAAQARVARLGLRLRTENAGGLLEGILPGTPGVCDQAPDPGTQVHAGTVITVGVAKRC